MNKNVNPILYWAFSILLGLVLMIIISYYLVASYANHPKDYYQVLSLIFIVIGVSMLLIAAKIPEFRYSATAFGVSLILSAVFNWFIIDIDLIMNGWNFSIILALLTYFIADNKKKGKS